MQETRDVATLASSAVDGIREALESLSHVSDGQRQAAIRRVLRERTVGLDEGELRGFLDHLRASFPDSAYDADLERGRLAARLEETEYQLREALAQNERLRQAGATQKDTARAVASAVAHGAGEKVDDVGVFQDFECVARVVMALSRFVVRQEEVARTTLKAVPGAAHEAATSGPSIGALLVATMRGDPGAEESFNAALARTAKTPAALLSAAEQSWKTGTQQVLHRVSPRHQDVGRGMLKAPAIVKELEKRHDEIFDGFNRCIDAWYRNAFNTMLKKALGE